jgi:DNA-binding XRE family transcriptional regulator
MTVGEDMHQRALAWRRFRRDYLYAQRDLAQALKCSLRTIVSIENEERVPSVPILQAFRDLARREKREAEVA